jgi:hypothetical protein
MVLSTTPVITRPEQQNTGDQKDSGAPIQNDPTEAEGDRADHDNRAERGKEDLASLPSTLDHQPQCKGGAHCLQRQARQPLLRAGRVDLRDFQFWITPDVSSAFTEAK